MSKKDRLDKGHTGQGISRRTDRAVRRSARAAESAARAIGRAPGYSPTPVPENEAQPRYQLVCKLFAIVDDLNRTVLARIPFDDHGKVSATLHNWPSAVEFEYEIWWGSFQVDSSSVSETEIRSDEGTLVIHVQLGGD